MRAVLLLLSLTVLAMLAGGAGSSESPGLPDALVPGGGDPQRGAAIAVDRERGHCVLCHRVSSLDAPFQGSIGPPLDGVAGRLDTAQLRLRVVDSTRVWADTAMPAYHRVDGLAQVAPAWQGRPVLDAQEVEDVVAWLGTLEVDR